MAIRPPGRGFDSRSVTDRPASLQPACRDHAGDAGTDHDHPLAAIRVGEHLIGGPLAREPRAVHGRRVRPRGRLAGEPQPWQDRAGEHVAMLGPPTEAQVGVRPVRVGITAPARARRAAGRAWVRASRHHRRRVPLGVDGGDHPPSTVAVVRLLTGGEEVHVLVPALGGAGERGVDERAAHAAPASRIDDVQAREPRREVLEAGEIVGAEQRDRPQHVLDAAPARRTRPR